MSMFSKKKAFKRPTSPKSSEHEEQIVIEDSKVYKPDFSLVDVDFIREIRAESHDSDLWCFEIHLKAGVSKKLMFENQKEAEYLYSRLFDLLAEDRKL